ncbi:ABC transporter substrate-binding protein [Arthrobacter sp. zg-Y820]|uniref:ABC transporter substrate-binding protein n=1 Tax=unclassified Arthrobacter TaxID=235627 RepID=UPI001E3CB4D5|nr:MULTISPECIES: ABC transporter substrate-binding protein [unclassified Arthrobacter]MCC9196803.1 ABC transporter substrate-binding protein [Arthrobacter sp. zg-Y820]MDK1279665.1 ABC transporter substrate-binding protein [Arthrobacter sp. zg.Y820]WIB07965.1 ABC transporter substrate-binding protein [Arthrobacter sp. zg-Y820]
MVITLALAGCAGDAADPAETNVGAEADSSAVLRVVTPMPSRSLDPIMQTSAGEQSFTSLLYDRLIVVDTNDMLLPGLATEWTFAEDGSYLELKLREDVTFHDGTPMNSDAVKINLDRGRETPESAVRQYLTDITSVDVVDNYTVRLNLAQGRGAGLPGVLTTNVGMMVSPKALAESPEKIATGGVDAGSGPYTVDSFVANEKSVFTAAENYWDDSIGQLSGIQIENVPDAITRLNAVRTGAADFASVSSPTDILQAEQLAKTNAIQTTDVQFRASLGLMINSSKGDMSQLEARQAVAYAIDPASINGLFSDRCTPREQIYPESEWPAIQDWSGGYTYDLEKSKQLVSKLGSVSIEITTPAGSNADQAGNAIQAQLTEAGIDAELAPVPVSEGTSRYIAGDLQSFVHAAVAPHADPAGTVDSYITAGYKLAATPEQLAEVEPLAVKAANPLLSQDERAELYQQIWKVTLDGAWYLPICSIEAMYVHSDKLMNTENIPWGNAGIQDLRFLELAK